MNRPSPHCHVPPTANPYAATHMMIYKEAHQVPNVIQDAGSYAVQVWPWYVPQRLYMSDSPPPDPFKRPLYPRPTRQSSRVHPDNVLARCHEMNIPLPGCFCLAHPWLHPREAETRVARIKGKLYLVCHAYTPELPGCGYKSEPFTPIAGDNDFTQADPLSK